MSDHQVLEIHVRIIVEVTPPATVSSAPRAPAQEQSALPEKRWPYDWKWPSEWKTPPWRAIPFEREPGFKMSSRHNPGFVLLLLGEAFSARKRAKRGTLNGLQTELAREWNVRPQTAADIIRKNFRNGPHDRYPTYIIRRLWQEWSEAQRAEA